MEETTMLNRRHLLLASIAAGVAMRNRTALANAAQPATPVNFDVPAGACDCHTHIHGDPEKFPFFAGRVYTPEPASPEEMAALHKALHIERVVIVTPSVYGTDNSATLFGMKARGNTARGVAVIDDKTKDSDLDAMGQAGIRGIRINLATGGVSDPNVARAPPGRNRTREGARLACPDLHQSSLGLFDQGPRRFLPGAGGVRPLRRRGNGTRSGTAGLGGSRGTGKVRQGLCENLRRLPGIEAGAGLS
jgi:hypothetical protein